MAQQFRTCFKVPNKQALRWFPGHMGKGMKQMQQKLKGVDCIIEVHDARIPMSGRNPAFKDTVIGNKPHILVLNKSDLAGREWLHEVQSSLKRKGCSNVLFTNSKDQRCQGVKQIVPLACDLISSADRFNRSEVADFQVMVIGVPNVGKSSLINTLRNRLLKKKAAAPTGAVAGITRSVQNRIKISEDPLIYLLDTPGILTPSIQNLEAGMRLALCSCFQDHLVGEILIADYLLYILNKYNFFQYVDILKLKEATDNISAALATSAINLKRTRKVKNTEGQLVFIPDLTSAAQHFIKLFREGKLGQIVLDKDMF